MPIYEYQCKKCGESLEVMQSITAPPLTKHNSGSKCGGKLTKLMSSNAFHLKGTGWYKTDYADKEKKAKEKSKPGEAEVKKESGEKKETTSKDSPAKKESTADKPKAEKKKEKKKD